MTEVYVTIQGDYNDGDYVRSMKPVSSSDQLDALKALSAAMKERGARYRTTYDFGCSEYCDESHRDEYPSITEEQWELIYDFIPGSESGIHSINEIKILYIAQIEDLLEVK